MEDEKEKRLFEVLEEIETENFTEEQKKRIKDFYADQDNYEDE